MKIPFLWQSTMLLQCLIGFVCLNVCSKFVLSTLPDCSNPSDVEKFIKSPQYSSLYTLNANLSKIAQTENDTERENILEMSLSVDDILPLNKLSYLQQRPPPFCNHSANAVFHITLLSLDSINESDMTFMLDFWLTIAWIDSRLRYPTSSRDVRILEPSWINFLWKPDVIFRNARQVTVHKQIVPNQGLKILKDKVLIFLSKMTVTLTCVMSFEKYPHDVQICDMKMESMLYTENQLVLSWDAELPYTIHREHEALKTPQFIVAKIKADNCSDPAYSSGRFSCIHIVFYLRRSLRYHIIHTYIPSASVVILSWITFWMKPEAIAARFGLGVTSLLTLVTLSTQSQKDLPPESYAKAIDIWMMSCALFVFSSILEFAIVNYLVSRFSENVQENICKVQDSENFLFRFRAVFTNSRIKNICRNIDRISRLLFPLCFILLNVWYWNKYRTNCEVGEEKCN